MKAFRFRLESALSLRSFAKQEAAMALAAATARRRNAEERLRLCQDELTTSEAELKPARGEAMTADELVRRQSSVAYCRDRVREAQDARVQAGEKEDERYHELMLARQEEEGLLRLKDRAKEAHRIEAIQADELAVEEFLNARQRSVLA